MNSTLLLSTLLFCAFFLYTCGEKLCVRLLREVSYAPGAICSFFTPGFMQPICSNWSKIQKELAKGNSYEEICREIGFYD
ncbi:hypothetical protein V3C99_019009 [Haemonchus contortus]|nr:unnamed protein product [Haemonchus contortus]